MVAMQNPFLDLLPHLRLSELWWIAKNILYTWGLWKMVANYVGAMWDTHTGWNVHRVKHFVWGMMLFLSPWWLPLLRDYLTKGVAR